MLTNYIRKLRLRNKEYSVFHMKLYLLTYGRQSLEVSKVTETWQGFIQNEEKDISERQSGEALFNACGCKSCLF